MAALPLDANGFRGAVLLEAGIYEVSEPGLVVEHSGFVIRGEGQGAGGTTITFTSTNRDANTITLGPSAGSEVMVGTEYSVTDSYVPTGSKTLSITDASSFAPGDRIVVQFLPNDDWLLHSTYSSTFQCMIV